MWFCYTVPVGVHKASRLLKVSDSWMSLNVWRVAFRMCHTHTVFCCATWKPERQSQSCRFLFSLEKGGLLLIKHYYYYYYYLKENISYQHLCSGTITTKKAFPTLGHNAAFMAWRLGLDRTLGNRYLVCSIVYLLTLFQESTQGYEVRC